MECPLCMEPLDLDDRSFFPCSCGYQICRFCWHRLRSTSHTSDFDSNQCPACRKPYQDAPANFKPVPLQELKSKREHKKKKSISKKELAELRVLQKNLIFVVGLSQKISDVELLKRNEYFGRFGRIVKVVVNAVKEGGGGGQQQQGSTAYITYSSPSEALRAVTTVNNTLFDGRTIKVNLGTTKYCSHFLKSQACPKQECMYLHSVGDEEASFTKEDMLRGRHSELERRLVEEWRGQQEQVQAGGVPTTMAATAAGASAGASEPRKKRGADKKPEKQQQKGETTPLTSSSPWQPSTSISSQPATSSSAPPPVREQPTGGSRQGSVGMATASPPPALQPDTSQPPPSSSDGRAPPAQRHESSSSPWQQQQQGYDQQQQAGLLHNGYHQELRGPPPIQQQPPPEGHENSTGLPNGFQLSDDLGFDPFAETQKEFEELIREEARRSSSVRQSSSALWGRAPFTGGTQYGGGAAGVVGAAITPQQSQLQPHQPPGPFSSSPFTLFQQLPGLQPAPPPPGYSSPPTVGPAADWLDDPAIIYSQLGGGSGQQRQQRPPPGFYY